MKRIPPTLIHLTVIAVVFGGMAAAVECITRPPSIFPTPEQQAHLDFNRAQREAAATRTAALQQGSGTQTPLVVDISTPRVTVSPCAVPQTEVTAATLTATP